MILRPAIGGVLVLATAAATAHAQAVKTKAASSVVAMAPLAAIESAPLEAITHVKNAPFSAEAVTEFVQFLGDGNRIERRYASSVARDSRGRTRRQEEIAMVGALAVDGPAPRLVTILDPDAGLSYTLDDNQRVAYRNQMWVAFAFERDKANEAAHGGAWTAIAGKRAADVIVMSPGQDTVEVGKAERAKIETVEFMSKLTTEALGTRTIEGVAAQGTRTTATIPEGAIGNLLPIEIVTERWFSSDLQEPVLITRRDPRAGETTYRLTSIQRSEPPRDLFVVPPGYEVREGELGKLKVLKQIETAKKVEAAAARKKGAAAKK
jgi:hypothetical protein